MKLNSKSINFSVDTVEELTSLDGVNGDICILTDEDRGGTFIYDDTAEDNQGTVFGYWRRQYDGAVNVKWFISPDDDSDDIGIQKAIDGLGGTYDLTSAYEFEPAYNLYIPQGTYVISNTLFINKNNIKIYGAGMFETVLKCKNTVNITEIVRFQGSYGSGLSDITLDGGLPFTPNLSETYGADIGLTLDQVALFNSRSLNIMNTRYEGKRCIHLWESYFDDLRIGNVGFFGTTFPNISGAIRFTLQGKQDNTFPGGESNNISYNKVSIGAVGSYVVADEVPIYNVFFNDITAEGRTWDVNYPSLGENKWIIGGTSQNVVINNGYTYAHHKPFNKPASLFYINNVQSGIKINNYVVYIEPDNTYPEIDTILEVLNNKPIESNVSVSEIGESSVKLLNASSGSKVNGTFNYYTDGTRTKLSLFNNYLSELRFIGKLIFKDASVDNVVYDYSAIGTPNQKWINMTPYRTLGVTYTNTFNFPIAVYFTTAPNATVAAYIAVDGIALGYAQATSNNYSVCTPSIIVPPNSTYSYNVTGATTYTFMYELLYQ